ncbi:MAG TPA: radical SAM protein, partial [bacterium]|nr:radical SAM protein [bacterium]
MTASDRLLRTVRQPGRYTGGEFNLPATASPSVVLAFPDLYEIGMSHFGTQILYWECVGQGIAVDRAYLPAPDLADGLRTTGEPLATLAARVPLRDVPLLGITVQHELAVTAVLELLDLGGIPLAAADRGDRAPLVIAGGPGIANPLPLAPFIDAFVPGDGEGFFAECRDAGVLDPARPRADRRRALAALPGVWVPGLTPGPVRARQVADLEAAPHPHTMLVPNFRIVQERAVVELARGCPNRCRFCQARVLYAPWRRRAPETVRALARELTAATGFDRLSLLTLNAAAYPDFNSLLRGLHDDLAPLHCSVMLPSQHVATLDPAILPLLASGRKGGLTLAPEAATERLRRVIGKQLSDQQLIDLCQAAAAAGWRQ